MNYEYKCLNYYTGMDISYNKIIIDESELISSPKYVHIFSDHHESYCVISNSLGIEVPFINISGFLIIGTSYYIYAIDQINQKVIWDMRVSSPCLDIVLKKGALIIICELDVVILKKGLKAQNYSYTDVVSNYMLFDDYVIIETLEGEYQKINFS